MKSECWTRQDKRARRVLGNAVRLAAAERAERIEADHLRRVLDGESVPPPRGGKPPDLRHPRRTRGICYSAKISPELVAVLERALTVANDGPITRAHLRAALADTLDTTFTVDSQPGTHVEEAA